MDKLDPIRPVFVTEKRGAVCGEILKSLPEWFAIPASVESYITTADELPMLACFDHAGEVVGFVSIKIHMPFAAEVYVMGVKKPLHRRGIGCALIAAVVELAIPQGVRFLTVKTLAPSHDDPNYARTRLFYEAVGFLPIEEFPTLWGPENPCLFMLRPL
jgi:ribosomal protein S18 acetylase RimI-like enzyme